MSAYICLDCKTKFDRIGSTKRCTACREAHNKRQYIKGRFGTPDVELRCVVCDYETENPEELSAHHIESRKKNPQGPVIVLCPNCHEAVHKIRKRQRGPLSADGLKIFGELVSVCTTRMQPGWRRPFS